MSSRRRLLVSVGAAAVAGGAALGCGSDDHENDPRPPSPIEVTARVDERRVVVDPFKVGAGLATITISNQSPDPISLTFDGPTVTTAPEIPPGGVDTFKAAFEEGEYEVSAGEASDARETVLEVGPEREPSTNELLQP